MAKLFISQNFKQKNVRKLKRQNYKKIKKSEIKLAWQKFKEEHIKRGEGTNELNGLGYHQYRKKWKLVVDFISNEGNKDFFMRRGKATERVQDRKGFRSSVVSCVWMGSVFWGKYVLWEDSLLHFWQNGGTTFLTYAQEFPAWPFLGVASIS